MQRHFALRDVQSWRAELVRSDASKNFVHSALTLAPFFLALWPAVSAVRPRKALKAYLGFDLATSQSNRTLHTHGHMTKTGPSWGWAGIPMAPGAAGWRWQKLGMAQPTTRGLDG